MKKLFIFSVLVVFFVGFAACGKKSDPKSDSKDITSFKLDGVPWNIDQNAKTITKSFIKGTIVSGTPTIELSHPKATYSPTDSQDFTNNTVTYTVTAENGITKEYKVTAMVSLQ